MRKRTLKYVLVALGLVAVLAWGDAIRSLVEYIFPLTQGGVKTKLAYVVAITSVGFALNYYLARIEMIKEKLTAKRKKEWINGLRHINIFLFESIRKIFPWVVLF